MKFKLLFSYRFLLFILSVLGVYLQLTKHGGFGMMLYYTILSNMLVMFFMGDMVWRMVRGRSTQTPGLPSYERRSDYGYYDYLCHLPLYVGASCDTREVLSFGKLPFVITSFL